MFRSPPRGVPPAVPLDFQASRAESGTDDLIEDAPRLAGLDHEEQKYVEATRKGVEQSIDADISNVFLRVLQHCKSFIEEKVNSIKILLQEDRPKKFYSSSYQVT